MERDEDPPFDKHVESYPQCGSVTIQRAHADRGSTGWYGNRHNDAVGWYWLRTVRLPGHHDTGVVHKRRRSAQDDAERTFPNISHWQADGPHRMIAVIREETNSGT